MKKVVLFTLAVLMIVSLVSLRGITGYTVADVSGVEFAGLGISAVGLVFVALLFAVYERSVLNRPKARADVWDELERAEKEWQKGRK